MKERTVMEREKPTTIEELVKLHLPGRYHDTLKFYEAFKHEDYLEYDEDGELIALVSYFYLDFKWDVIITMAKDNRFTKKQWKVLSKTIDNRAKMLRIMSDPNNPALRKAVDRHGGYWVEDEIIFP